MQWDPSWGHFILSPWSKTGVTAGIPVIYDYLMEGGYSGPLTSHLGQWSPGVKSINPYAHNLGCKGLQNPCLKSSRDAGSFPNYLSPEKSLIHFRHLLTGNGSCVSLLRMSKHFPLRFT